MVVSPKFKSSATRYSEFVIRSHILLELYNFFLVLRIPI